MIFIVAPEPADWLGPTVEVAAACGPVSVFAPWAVGMPAPGVLPERLRRAWERRRMDSRAGVTTRAGWLGAELALRAWARDRTDRLMTARFLRRQAADLLAARALIAGARAVIAPSLAARSVFAAAPPECLKILLEDLPSFRQLHADLDLAALAHPDCRFLRRYRAPARLVARQEAERVLADALLVRGRFAAEQRADAGKPVLPVPLPLVNLARSPPAPSARRRVLLAGLATARNGSVEALHAAGDWELLVRPGEGMEPTDLLSRPNVRAARPAEIATLDGIDLVIAPTWCESHPEELRRAAAARVPAIATRQAAGWLDVTEVPPGDAAALRAAAERARPPEPDTADPSSALRSLIRGESTRRMLATSLGG